MNEQVLNEARDMIAGFLRQRREELGITQEALAEACGFHRHTIRNMEQGRFWPNLKQFLVITHHLKCFFFLETHEGIGNPAAEAMKRAWQPGDPGSSIRGDVQPN